MVQPATQSSAQLLGRKVLATYLRGENNRWLVIIVFAAVSAPTRIGAA